MQKSHLAATILLLAAAALMSLAGCAWFTPGESISVDDAAPKWVRPADWDKIKADPAALDKYRCPKPREFASVFSFGYGGNEMPEDDAKFEELLVKAKAAGYNVIHTSYTPSRIELCRKHGLKMMIDFLDRKNHHVYKNIPGCEAVCKKVEGDPAVWGYNIWNDMMNKIGPGRKRDIGTVRRLDPSHPAYAGCYRAYGMRHVTNADIFGYYDFHWQRGIGAHFGYQMRYLGWARQRNAHYYSWFAQVAGRVGEQNVRRSLWSANTAMACGQKGILWFLALGVMDKKTLELKPAYADAVRVHKEIMPLKREIMKVGNPIAVYSTMITKNQSNQALPKPAMPPGLGGNAFPKGFWIQPAGGEFVMGVFKDDKDRDAVFVANHNAFAPQDVKLKLAKAASVSIFNRKTGRWKSLADGVSVGFKLDAAGGELLRFE